VTTIVHLLRHGEVHNPTGVLYGRMPGYHLSEAGRAMAETAAAAVADRDITVLVTSPLDRAQETAVPFAKALGLEAEIDDRVIESTNKFEGKHFGVGDGVLRKPSSWPLLWNPFKPSWGEPYADIARRMVAAIHDARLKAEGHEALIVSHQLPIWTTRLHLEGRSFLHDPRRRQCSLCSLTSLAFDGDRLVAIGYAEPAGHLIAAKDRRLPFSSGGSLSEGEPS
jgi:broad specificity phosphatase PhoE